NRRYLFAMGSSVTSYDLDGNGTLLRSEQTMVVQPSGNGGVSAVVDPAENHLYLTGPRYVDGMMRVGAFAATVGINGELTTVSHAYPMPQNALPRAIVLAR